MSISGDQNKKTPLSGGAPTPRSIRWRVLGKRLLRWPFTSVMPLLAAFIARSVGEYFLLILVAAFLDKVIALRLKIFDIQEEVRALKERGMTRRYHICTFFCRYYITSILCVMAALGAENWLVGAFLLIAGLTVDSLRARRSPDLYLEIGQIVDNIDAAATGQRRVTLNGWRRWEPLIFIAGFVVYMMVLLIAARPSLPENLQGYLALFSPLHDLTTLFLRASRRVVGQLDGAGLPDRALLAAHLFAISWVFMVAFVARLTLISHRSLVLAAQVATNPYAVPRNGWSIKHLIGIAILAVVFYWVQFGLISVDFVPGRKKLSFHVHMSNGPYHMLVVGTLMITCFLTGLYGLLLRTRLQLWLGWQERHLSTAAATATSEHRP